MSDFADNPSANCLAAYMSMHITTSASGAYLENVWLWTADHDLDSASSTQISVYTGRGLLIEPSGGTCWL
jgi:glucan 1,3-beta-glucosidase